MCVGIEGVVSRGITNDRLNDYHLCLYDSWSGPVVQKGANTTGIFFFIWWPSYNNGICILKCHKANVLRQF